MKSDEGGRERETLRNEDKGGRKRVNVNISW